MIEFDLRRELEEVAGRYRRLRLWSSLALCWLALTIAGLLLTWYIHDLGRSEPWVATSLVVSSGIAALACVALSRRAARDQLWIARRIEGRFPELDARLLTAIEQWRENPTGRLGFLQQTVVYEVLAHARRGNWEEIVPERRLRLAKRVQLVVLTLFAIVAGNLYLETQARSNGSRSPDAAIREQGEVSELTVEPGDTSIERGTSLLVLARFKGPLPTDVELIYQPAPDAVERLAMSKSLDDPLFAGRISSADEELLYSIRYGGTQTDWYRVTVFDYPELVQADARLTFPEYTGMTVTVIEDVRSVTAVEGTRLALTFRLNKPVKRAILAPSGAKEAGNVGDASSGAANGDSLTLAAESADSNVYSLILDMTESRRYRLHLIDHEGRKNKQPPELAINVTPNRPPEVKLVTPGRDVQASPLEELALRARLWDDFGLRRYGMSYSIAGQAPQEVTLGESVPAKDRREVDHVLALETLKAEPDQLLSYYFWAEDHAADGSVRRTSGDMFFAEVRPFEEIYRQGEQPTGEQMRQMQQQAGGQNAQQAEQLANLQKQIINATWKLIRRETSAVPSPKFGSDLKLVQESQTSAKEQADELGENLQDPRSRAYLEAVLKHMEQALGELERAAKERTAKPLDAALAAEQAAYQGLLKLRAREHEVVRGNRQQAGGGGGGGGGNRSQQQLDQLELSQQENRYETERTAQAQQESAEQRETRQVLNRLRELAQRQEDLNKQMKELQTALEEARDPEKRDEIRKQLARLRDQQQEQLRDTDELRDRMDRPENQERMADAREQLDQTRNNVRRASEALEQGMVSEAAAAGARATEELNTLRDQFRQSSASQFTDAMQQMREEARGLDQRQQELSNRLSELGKSEPRTLRDSNDRQATAEQLKQQKQDLDKLLENMRQTIEAAETTEPLLSKQLYDTVRESREDKPQEALEVSSQLLDRGFLNEARTAEQQAGRGITNLRERVEKAASSVLGNEAEALRRARSELDALAEQLNREIDRAQGGADPQPAANPVNDQIAQNRSQRGSSREGSQPGQRNAEDGPSILENGQQKGGQQRDGEQTAPGDNNQKSQQQANSQEPGSQPSQSQQQQGGHAGSPEQQQQGEQSGSSQQDSQQQDSQEQRGQQQGAQRKSGRGGQSPQADAEGDGNREGGSLREGSQRPGSREQGGRPDGSNPQEDLQRFLGGGTSGPGDQSELAPLTGEGFRDWSDRLRDVEEMVSDPRLRAEAARIRDRARSMRADYKRHSKEPNWELVQEFISRPLVELRDAVGEELLRREASEQRVPIDREPVPPEYVEQVRRYYERLGSGR